MHQIFKEIFEAFDPIENKKKIERAKNKIPEYRDHWLNVPKVLEYRNCIIKHNTSNSGHVYAWHHKENTGARDGFNLSGHANSIEDAMMDIDEMIDLAIDMDLAKVVS